MIDINILKEKLRSRTQLPWPKFSVHIFTSSQKQPHIQFFGFFRKNGDIFAYLYIFLNKTWIFCPVPSRLTFNAPLQTPPHICWSYELWWKNSHQDDGDKIVEFWPFNSLFGGKSSKYSIMSANEAPRRDKFSG